MPELPEVETLCRQMDRVLSGKEVVRVFVHDPKLRPIGAASGRRVLGVNRHAKSIVISLNGPLFLIIHLRMTGRLLWAMDASPIPHCRASLVFHKGWMHLVDPRRFATLTLLNDIQGKHALLDLFEGARTADLKQAAAKRRCPVKIFLMDQKALGGIGNIYACEILHRAAISPWRRACDLDSRQWDKIRKAAASILEKAIACRGTSISDWADLFGHKGNYQKYLRAYGRKGDACHRCGAPIIRAVLSGRGTFFCTSCQAV